LPAPADPAPQLVAIHVEIWSAAAEPIAQGDAEDVEPAHDRLDSADVTSALPALAKTGEANDRATLDASESKASDENEPLGAVANVDAEQVPAAVPVPLRRPVPREAVEESKPLAKATTKVVPRKLVTASRPRSRTASRPANKRLLLGGRMATPMPEYPSPAQTFGGPD